MKSTSEPILNKSDKTLRVKQPISLSTYSITIRNMFFNSVVLLVNFIHFNDKTGTGNC